MKKFIPILSLSFVVIACSTEPQTDARTLQSVQQNAGSVDTAGLAQFQRWKAQNELAAVTPVQQVEEQPVPAPVKEVTIIREVRVHQPAPVRRAVKKQTPPVQERPEPVAEQPSETAGGSNGEVASNTGSTGTVGESAPAGETAKEGGWSHAKKGAVIGGAGGAVIGAVIGKKNRAAGAVIGGVLGGAVGYGLGKKKDNNDANN
jgi:hypothetical protein